MSETARIPLTKGYEAIIDASDLELVSQYKWHAVVSKKTGDVYAVTTSVGQRGSKRIKMHRLLLGMPRQHVDHHNGDTLDNRRENLRTATVSQNQMNRRPNRRSASGFKGVSLHKRSGRWQAEIQKDGKKMFLGSFGTPELAALAYDSAARELFGEFARPNFPPSIAT